MADLSEERLDIIVAGGSGSVDRVLDDMISMAAEIRRHRSAVAADRERVRGVVSDAWRFGMDHHDNESIQLADWNEIRDRIATRAAERLATAAARLTEEEADSALGLLDELAEKRMAATNRGQIDDAEAFGDWHSVLAKLLGAR